MAALGNVFSDLFGSGGSKGSGGINLASIAKAFI